MRLLLCWRIRNKNNSKASNFIKNVGGLFNFIKMKNLLILCCLVLVGHSYSQTKPVKILFDVTSKDTLTHQAVLRHVTGMSKAYPQSDFEIVIYGGALSMALPEKSTVKDAIKKLEGNPHVSIKVCEETMKRYKIEKSQLLPSVGTVPDAIMEIVTKQGEGWGYIKEAHN